ncbi:DUF4418 family protein [Geomobilimonas luticola]|uniref:DUF4418 family protein n=1 Tax=Geomobilimonas luticola TaxID=1114878 RepID=A0ABS5SEN4_9BACT|nr:DUF4418 family protein [Geomobilimonas luticola]MBT0653829.1 DUF4418 family protein [Geomobilimonas luticola]
MTESRRKYFAVPLLLAVTGGLLVAIPRWLFPTCGFAHQSMAGAMMRCDTTGSITLFLGVATLVAALALYLLSSGPARSGVLFAAVAAGCVLFPLYLVWPGVCMAATMPCRMGTLPAVLLTGGVQVLVAVTSLVRSRSRRA